MNDITDLFSNLGPAAAQDPPAEVIDADIARERHALAQSRRG